MRKLNLKLAFVLTLTLGGCSQILGIGDYDIDPRLDDNEAGKGAGGDGDAGEGASAAGAAAGNVQGGTSQGGSSQAGDAGMGAAAGAAEPMAGAGGADAGAGAGGGGGGGGGTDSKFKGCDGTPFAGNEAIVRSCILRVGCQLWNYPENTISRCVSQNTQSTYEGTKCTLDAQSCADIAECEGTHDAEAFCATHAEGQYCDGNDVVNCYDDYLSFATACTKYGGTCNDFGVDLGNGDTVACALDQVTTCTETDDTETCGGPANGYKYQCQDDVAYGIKCSNFAASCQADSGGDVGCFYPLNNCTTEGVVCANDRATWCDGTSKATFDCGSVGLDCATSGDYSGDSGRQCAAPGCTPTDVADCQESCSGSKLSFCYGGAPVTVDCKDYGFKTCVEYTGDDAYDCDVHDLAMGDCVTRSDVISFAECE